VIWRPELTRGVLIVASAPFGFETASAFDPLKLGPALADRINSEGRRIVIDDPSGDVHLLLQDASVAQRPALMLPLDGAFEDRLEVALAFYRRLCGERTKLPPRAVQLTPMQRARLILLLRTFDFHQAGAGPREIAAALIDAKQAALPAIEWKSSAAHRKASRLIHDALALVNGGYLKLLRGGLRLARLSSRAPSARRRP
jgi:hypothetical protein